MIFVVYEMQSLQLTQREILKKFKSIVVIFGLHTLSCYTDQVKKLYCRFVLKLLKWLNKLEHYVYILCYPFISLTPLGYDNSEKLLAKSSACCVELVSTVGWRVHYFLLCEVVCGDELFFAQAEVTWDWLKSHGCHVRIMTYSVNWCEASWVVTLGWHYNSLIGDVAPCSIHHSFQERSFLNQST